jgi:hypothetical protein
MSTHPIGDEPWLEVDLKKVGRALQPDDVIALLVGIDDDKIEIRVNDVTIHRGSAQELVDAGVLVRRLGYASNALPNGIFEG